MTSWSSILLLGAADPASHVLPHRMFDLGGHPVTNHMLMLVLAAVLLMVVLPIAAGGLGVASSSQTAPATASSSGRVQDWLKITRASPYRDSGTLSLMPPVATG